MKSTAGTGTPHGVVDRPGPYCTVQDLGRTSGRRAGLAPGGAMDQRAYLWANRLLDNDPRAAALEVTLGGFAITFATETVVALTGADCAATLDDAEMGAWRTIRARPGQVLRLAYSATGMRAYLAFPGGLATDRAFGSASGVARDGLPGLLGRPLREGEPLRWKDPHRAFPNRHVPAYLVPPASVEQPVLLPLIVGYEWSEFSEADRKSVFGEEWTIGPASDRTAIRLDGPELASGPETLDSSPLVDGTVQVTGDSRPLVFMRDRPTIGGYPKLGGTDLISLDTLAQARPGSRVRFVRAVPDALRRAMVRREKFFEIR